MLEPLAGVRLHLHRRVRAGQVDVGARGLARRALARHQHQVEAGARDTLRQGSAHARGGARDSGGLNGQRASGRRSVR